MNRVDALDNWPSERGSPPRSGDIRFMRRSCLEQRPGSLATVCDAGIEHDHDELRPLTERVLARLSADREAMGCGVGAPPLG